MKKIFLYNKNNDYFFDKKNIIAPLKNVNIEVFYVSNISFYRKKHILI